MTRQITPFYENPDDIMREQSGLTAAEEKGLKGEVTLYKMLKEQLPDNWRVLYRVNVFYQKEREADFLVIVPGNGIINLECKNFTGAQIEGRGSSFLLQNGDRSTPLRRSYDTVQTFYNCVKKDIFEDCDWGIYARAVIFPCLNFLDGDHYFDFGENPIYTEKDCKNPGLKEIILQVFQWQEQTLHVENPRHPSEDDVERLYSKYALQGSSCAAFTHPGVAENQRIMEALLKYGQRDVLAQIMDSKNQIIHVTGSAGTGKTWLAMAAAKKYLEQSKKVLYVCFNKALSFYLNCDDSEQENFKIRHFDALDQLCFNQRVNHDYSYDARNKMSVFERNMLNQLARKESKFRPDIILIDEAQDFSPAKFEFLTQICSRDEHRKIIFFSDSKQNLYQSSETMCHITQVLKPESTELKNNLRNTKKIFDKCDELVELTGTTPPVISGVDNVEETLTMQEALDRIEQLYNDYPLSDVAILAATDELLKQVRITGITFNTAEDIKRKDVKNWKILKTIAWRSTIHAFKGLEAACVVILIPSDQINVERSKFMRYVAASRAQYKLVIFSIKPTP